MATIDCKSCGAAAARSPRTASARGRVAAFALAAVSALSVDGTASAAASRAGILSIDEIRPGMIGVGKTVFHGTQIEEFQVEILSVLKNISPDGDMILARASGGPLAETGIIAGMSGSPVYVDGKLIGAVAFAWSFAKVPIAGITPIGEMLDVMDRRDLGPDGEAGEGGAAGALGRAAGGFESLPGEPDPFGDVVIADADAGRAGVPSGTRLRPIQTPVSVAGFDPRVADQLLPWLERRGFSATVGGNAVASAAAGGGADAAAYEAVPGAAVGVQLVSGDASVTAIGTVTYREGNRIIAFGHPLFQAGDVDLPMTGAYIHGVMPSALSSFKMGSALSPLGTLTQDRRTAVSGNVGPSPRSIPVTVTLRVGKGAAVTERAYHYGIVEDKSLSPGLVQFAAVNSVLGSEAAFAEQTIASRVTYRFAGGRTLALENLFSGFSSLEKLGDEASAPAALVLQNRYEKVAIDGVDVELSIIEGRRTGRLEAISVSKNPVRAGETISVLTTVKTYQGPLRTFTTSVSIPPGTEDGDLTLRVCDASTLDESETKRAPQRLDWEDFATFLDAVAERRRNDRVYTQLEAPDAGITIAGQEFPRVPRSFFAVIDSDRHTENAGVIGASILAKTEVDAGVVVTGCKTLTIRVNHRTP